MHYELCIIKEAGYSLCIVNCALCINIYILKMKRVAIIGTQGVPARYGGFETLVENIIGDNCSKDIEYTVFCSSKDLCTSDREYRGAKLRYVGISANGVQSIVYDIVSLMRALSDFDTILVLGVSGCIFLPFFKVFSDSRVVVNIDGLEWKRAKWNGFAKWFLKLSEKVAVWWADVVIADNQGIVDYVEEEYKLKAELIAYGGDHVVKDIPEDRKVSVLKEYGLEKGNYAVTVCRIEPENNCDMILEAFARNGMPLLFIGNWERSDYGKGLLEKYKDYGNITMHGPMYDLDTLNVLRSESRYYIHGHSAGGTNPSLVEAMFSGCNILAYDVVYNRETMANMGAHFGSTEELVKLVEAGEVFNSEVMMEVAEERYTWKRIARRYERLY